jgi:hypothetical protein
MEPPWAFTKPLIVLVPFASGMLAMHPTFSPLDYHTIRLVHASSAALVFIMIPFSRLLNPVHVPVTEVQPELAWPASEPALDDARLARAAQE